jgi:hypothetical protein
MSKKWFQIDIHRAIRAVLKVFGEAYVTPASDKVGQKVGHLFTSFTVNELELQNLFIIFKRCPALSIKINKISDLVLLQQFRA